MQSVVLATADEEARSAVLSSLAQRGHGARTCSEWRALVPLVARDTTQIVLVDPGLPELDLDLLQGLAGSLPHAPAVRQVDGTLPEDIELLLQSTPSVFTSFERRLLPLAGLGPDVLETLHKMAHNPLPVRLHGERGTGKEWLARKAHALRAGDRSFAIVRPGEEPVIRGQERAGTLYLENIDRHDKEAIATSLTLARANGWRVMAGSRRPPITDREGMKWTHLHVRALRERPREIRPLTRLYLETYGSRLGLGRRRITRDLWSLIEAYSWPGNQRELESFVVQAVTSAKGPWVSPRYLPPRVLALLDPTRREKRHTQAFEEVVEDRLRTIVARFDPATPGDRLHQLVVDATERALIRLVLSRTGGNQKAAAELLGLARNTLRSRMDRLDPFNEQST